MLSDIGFTIRAGEVLGLIGPNGAGKTTVLECVAGLLPSDSGKLTFRGHPLSFSHRKEALFYMPEGILPWAEQSVRRVLKFFENIYGLAPDRLKALAGPLRLQEEEIFLALT